MQHKAAWYQNEGRKMEFSKLYRTVKTYLRYRARCSKPASLILVLIFGHSFVNYGLVAILVSYLTSTSNINDLLSAAMVTNVREGLASVLTIVVAHVADASLGQFRMTILSSLAYLFGLLLLWLLHMVNKLGYGTLMVAVMLISFGQAGREPTMKALFADQLRNGDSSIDKDRLDACTTFWWRIMRSLGAIVATLLLTFLDLSWGLRFGIAVAVMGTGFLIFLSGFKIYHHPELTGSPLTTVFQVFIAALRKQGSRSDDPNNYYMNNTVDEQPFKPDISLFRWLDKAALVTTLTPSLEQQEKAWKLCTVNQVKNAKLLLRMSPLWATFFVYSLVSAAGSTFFFEQSSKLDDQLHIGGVYINVPLTLFFFIQKASGSAISSMYELLIPRGWSVSKMLGATKLRMGVGMVFSCLCCVVARQVETRRLNKLAEYTDEQLENENTNMSISFLAPQFCLLGFMEGLARDGLYDFFHYQVVESMRSYGPSFNEFVLGIGKFNSILFMLIFQSWFGKTIDESKVNNYYGVLSLACLGNLFIFTFVVKYVYKDAKGRMEDLIDQMEEDGKRIKSIEDSSSNENPHAEGDISEM